MGKYRKEDEELAYQPEPQLKPQIPFSHWFDGKVKSGKLRDYQDEALLVFFSKRGLKDIEDEDSYNKALETF